ncbi:MAG: hydroxymethylbilane synthase [Ktedonobacterales bacterium]
MNSATPQAAHAERLKQPIRVGTRSSKLALAQTALVVGALRTIYPAVEIQVTPITTKGDVATSQPLRDIGDSGLFVATIEMALRAGEIDLAVHSAKDLSSTLADDLALVAFPARADARDVLISRGGESLDSLPEGARVGTSSVRRICQLRHLRPGLEIVDLRGNVDTRLRKLENGACDALVLAKAGLDRLEQAVRVDEIFSPELLLPAVAQGALALEARASDGALARLISPLDDYKTRLAVLAERAFAARLGGGCHVPIGAYAEVDDDGRLAIRVMLGDLDGHLIKDSATAEIAADKETSFADAGFLGVALAERLLDAGGSQLLFER